MTTPTFKRGMGENQGDRLPGVTKYKIKTANAYQGQMKGKAVGLPPQSEADFERAVVDFAHLQGWRVAGFRPARVMRKGKEIYETPIKHDGAGFPDLVMVRDDRIVIAELKSEKGKLSTEQKEWKAAFDGHSYGYYFGVHVWRPSDWPKIEEVLKR